MISQAAFQMGNDDPFTGLQKLIVKENCFVNPEGSGIGEAGIAELAVRLQ